MLSGLGARYILSPAEPRDQAFIRLFKAFCLPLENGAAFSPPDGIERSEDIVWKDVESEIIVSYSEPNGIIACTVTDFPKLLQDEERNQVFAVLKTLIPNEFPQLDQNEVVQPETWTRFFTWMEHPEGDPRRWGIIYSQANPNTAATPGHAVTQLTLATRSDL